MPALGAMTGGQAVQMVKAGLKAIYLSGWQVAADANLSGNTYPDQSLYPANSAPALVKRINSALLRADQITHAEGDDSVHWLAPIVADAEAGFGGPLNAYEIMKSFIEAGAAAVHFEDQLSSEKKCGHLGGKVLVPTAQHIRTLVAARLAADVGRRADTDRRAHGRPLGLAPDERHRRDRPRVLHRRAHARGLLPRPRRHRRRDRPRPRLRPVLRSDLVRDRRRPDMAEAEKFAAAIHEQFPDQLLAYNCSPSFNWRKHLSDAQIAAFQRDLAALGYRFQFITLAGFHAVNLSMFELARGYGNEAMPAYVRLQEREFELEDEGYTATRHQREVGAGYFDQVLETITGGTSSTLALKGSTEEEQFEEAGSPA